MNLGEVFRPTKNLLKVTGVSPIHGNLQQKAKNQSVMN
ncbi:hypothetical protein pb186bvf_007596 [Paramecium bursaria]